MEQGTGTEHCSLTWAPSDSRLTKVSWGGAGSAVKETDTVKDVFCSHNNHTFVFGNFFFSSLNTQQKNNIHTSGARATST